jgi:hypothetical protein
VKLSAASFTFSLPRFFVYPDSVSKSVELMKQEYYILDDSKWKAAQCSVWLNNTSNQNENTYVGIIANSKVYWTRLRLNENSFIAIARNISDSLSEFIKKNTHDKASFIVWNIQLQPGVNHISIDFGLNNFPNQPDSEIDITTWKLYPIISSEGTNAELNAILKINEQKDFNFLSLQPSVGWQKGDSLLRWSVAQNFDSAEVSYSFKKSLPSLNANEISWEAAFQQLEILTQKNLSGIFWKSLKPPTFSPSQTKNSWLLLVISIPFLAIIFFLLKKIKII